MSADDNNPMPRDNADTSVVGCAGGAAPVTSLSPQPLRCAVHPPRALLLWDGECLFCARWAKRVKRIAGDRIDCEPYQTRMGDFPEIAPAQFERAVFLILPDAMALHSARAIYRALALRWPLGVLHWLYCKCPAFARLSERRYRKIAANRRCLL